MKKILVLVAIFIVIFSSAASAATFWDYFFGSNQITGRSAQEVFGIQEGEEAPAEPAPEPVPEPTPEPAPEPVAEPEPVQEPIAPEQPTDPNYAPEQPRPDQEGCWVGDQQVPCPSEQQQPTEQMQPQQPYQQYPDYSQTVCGDGICEGEEKYGCHDDCGLDNIDKKFFHGEEKYGSNWCKNGQCCPDTICDEFEQKTRGCPMDCGGTTGSGGMGQAGQYQYNQRQGPNFIGGQCLDENMLKNLEIKCGQNGGQSEVIDVSGCKKINCKMGNLGGGFISGGGYEGIGMSSQQCQSMGLVADVSPGINGPEVRCVNPGEQRNGVVKGEIDATEALEFVFKLEEIKMKLDKDGDLYKKVENLMSYYEKQGDSESAARYSNALSMMGEARIAIDSLREQIKSSIESEGKLTVENLYMFKGMVNEIVDNNLMKIAYAMLGVDVTMLKEEDVTAENCEKEGICFEEKFRVCAIGTIFYPEDGVQMTITGNDGESCLIDLEVNGQTMSCSVSDYKYMPLSRETFEKACGGNLEVIKDETRIEGGKERFCKSTESCNCNEICEEQNGEDEWCDDCLRFGMCGDGLCEPKAGENFENCQTDCTKSTIEETSTQEVEQLNEVEIGSSEEPIEEVIEDIAQEEIAPNIEETTSTTTEENEVI